MALKNPQYVVEDAAPGSPVCWDDLYGRIKDEAIIEAFARCFYEGAAELIKSARQAVAQKSAEKIESAGHAIKGASSNLGAIALAKAAWQLENAGKEKRLAECEDLFVRVETEFERLMTLLQQEDWLEQVKQSG